MFTRLTDNPFPFPDCVDRLFVTSSTENMGKIQGKYAALVSLFSMYLCNIHQRTKCINFLVLGGDVVEVKGDEMTR